MVKPPRTMQPEGVDLKKAGRAPGRAFQNDSFHNYMARKIDLQRQQFGVMLPPPPPPHVQQQQQQQQYLQSTNRDDDDDAARILPPQLTGREPSSTTATKSLSKRERVSFAPFQHNAEENENKVERSRKKRKKSGMMGVLERLKRRHGKAREACPTEAQAFLQRKQETRATDPCTDHFMTQHSSEPRNDQVYRDAIPETTTPAGTEHTKGQHSDDRLPTPDTTKQLSPSKSDRPDLFFLGVVVIINGYTHPDSESLQRLLQQHGGDVERYETSRVTHVIAEHLSMAKAKIYARQRKPTPVVYPSWIVNSVKEQRLLPHAPYLIREVRNLQQQPSVVSFFQEAAFPQVSRPQADQETPPIAVGSEKPRELRIKELNPKTTDRPTKDHGRAATRNISGSDNLLEQPSTPRVSETAQFNPDSLHNQFRADVDEIKTPHLEPIQETHEASSPTARDTASSVLHQKSPANGRTNEKYINGQIRTVGTDPNFLETFFAQSRLSFIGSFRRRECVASSEAVPDAIITRGRPSNRYVLHVDMDSFFAAVVLRNYPEYVNKPVAICHFGKSGPDSAEFAKKDSTCECATINYEARKFGLKKGMYLGRARAMCPSLTVLPYDFDGYQEVSEQVSEICHQYAAEHFGSIEAVSCDELYMEVYTENSETVKQLAEDIRREIVEATRCTATVGIANNKFLAKVATDRVKPNGCCLATDHVDLLKTLQLRDLHGVGYRSEPKLTGKGFVSVQDVWSRGESAETELQAILGKQLGTKIYNFCRGKDDRPVQAADRKTIGAECNYGVRFDGPYGVDYMIEGLCKEVQKRMEHVGITGKKVTLKVKQRKEGAKPPPKFLGHGSCHNLSKSRDCGLATRQWNSLALLCKKMFKEMKVKKEDVRGMGVIVSKLSQDSFKPTGGIKSFFQSRQIQKYEPVCNHGDEPEPHESQQKIKKALEKNFFESNNDKCASLRESSQDFDDENNDNIMVLSQSSASSAGLEYSSTKRNRRPLDSLREIGFVPVIQPRRRSMDAPAEGAEGVADSGRRTDSVKHAEEASSLSEKSAERNTKPFAESSEPSDKDQEATAQPLQPEDSIDDIALPSLSQLHMSQVEFLPTQMRRRIQAKIEECRAVAVLAKPVVAASHQRLELSPQKTRFRQTDVGRMMRLAAVKAGCADAATVMDISMTQLDRLPVEVQLQVTNKDSLPLGKPTPRKKAPSRRGISRPGVSGNSRVSRPASVATSKQQSSVRSRKASQQTNRKSEMAGAGFEPPFDEQEFFHQNILPLSGFLDECGVSEENLDILKDFLQHFTSEYSWHEVVLLLRSLRHRRDEWSKSEVIKSIVTRVNEKYQLETGEELDIGCVE